MKTDVKQISFVVTSRNDGETDDELMRLQTFVSSLSAQCDRFHLDAELILVEWNPPAQKSLLVDAIKWPKPSSACTIRIIQVPQTIHKRFENSDVISLFQMIAKNVGIRRARGRFVLATNVDILFSNALIQFLASGQLSPERMYRIDRHDVPSIIPPNLSLDDALDWCSLHILRVYRYLETVDVINGVIPPSRVNENSTFRKMSNWFRKLEAPLHTNACGDFTLLSAEYWMKVAGNPEFPVRAMKLDGLLCYAAHYAGAREMVLKDPLRIYHLEHPARADGALVALSGRSSENQNLQVPLSQYQAYIDRMRNLHDSIIFNNLNWGLADETLPETIIT